MTEDLHYCENDCAAPPVFPVRPVNAPGLERIRYRIGDYHSIREALLYGINRAGPLQHWTHRLPDDPAIALLEGAAIVGDILTFYQEHYANEAWLRTATWRDSVSELVRLLGYRLSPALAGGGAFSLEIKGTKAITVPAHFPLKADLADMPEPAEFETSQELIAYPHLSKFHLYPPRLYADSLTDGTKRFEIAKAGADDTPEAIAAVNLKKGDLLMIAPADNESFMAQPLVVKVAAVTTLLDRLIVDIDGPLTVPWKKPIKAWRLGRTFKQHGSQAPLTEPGTYTDANGTLYHTQTPRSFKITSGFDGKSNAVWLDTEVKDLTPGTTLIIEVLDSYQREWPPGSEFFWPYLFTVVRTITAVKAGAVTHAGFSSSALRVSLDKVIPAPNSPDVMAVDIRDLRYHEATSPALTLRPVASYSSSWPAAPKLEFQGTQAEANTLLHRRVFISKPGAEALDRTIVQVSSVTGNPRRWSLQFDAPLAPLYPADFDETKPVANVFGNVVEATQGRTEPETPLGNGDASAVFQTFKLPKPLLTYRIEAGATPAEVPELEVFVTGLRWQRVDSFFGQPFDAEIYIVREDNDGNSYVQFGDGINGARLPSGLGNISARWRRGSGAHGPVKPDTDPKATAKLDGLDKVHLPGLITGGCEREHMEKARLAAPGRVQGLGRIVSLGDYETELLGIPGIIAATAAWDAPYGTPAVVLRVLLASGREKEQDAICASVRQFQHERGPDSHPLVVLPCTFKSVRIEITCALDSRYRQVDVEAAMSAALGFLPLDDGTADGLFALRRRRIGQPEYRDRIEAVVQNVPGIVWCTAISGNLDCGSEHMLRLEGIAFTYATPGTSKLGTV